MTWHPEILTRKQERVLAQIGPLLSRWGFYLAGGTAVALHMGHRRSVDFDWFTAARFAPLELAQELRDHGIAFVTEAEATGTLHGRVRGIPVSLLRHNYPLLAKTRTWRKIRIAARADLSAMKLSAIAQRGAKKDFVDLYALGREDDSVRKMVRWYRKKYAVEEIGHLVRSLAYFDDAQAERMPRMLWKVNWRTTQTVIHGWVRAVA